MPVTVADLLADPALGLTLHTRHAAVGRPIGWVHVSELADPAPFLQGGELLLTTGLGLSPGSAAAGPVADPAGPVADPAEDYVRRLADAGVVALGLGTGLSHAEVPPDLVAAAEACGLALLEVPRQTPFTALSRKVSAALAADEYATVARSASAQQELTRAALAPGAPLTVLERLARQVDGWVLLTDATGAPLHAVPAAAVARAPELREELDRLRGTRAPASAALSGPGETVLLQSLGNGPRTRGFLVVGRAGPFPPAERHVVNAAVLLLTLRLEQSRALDSALAVLRAALLRLLLTGAEATVADVVDVLGERLPAEPLRVLTVLGSPAQRAAAVDVAADAAVHAGAALFSAELDDVLVLVVPDGGAAEDGPADRLTGLPARVPGSWLGVSGPVTWAGLAEGVRQARQAGEHGRARGVGTTSFADLAAPGLAALLDPAATRAFAEALLAPLRAADRSGAGDLVASLRVWLAHHGQWEPAAAELGVHRHTLRKRMHRAAELLDRDLDDPGTRAELWLALHPPADGYAAAAAAAPPATADGEGGCDDLA